MDRGVIAIRIGSLVALAALVIELVCLCWSPDFDGLSLFLWVAPIAAVIFVAVAVWAGTTKVLRRPVALLLVYLVVSCVIGASASLRSEVRWLLARGIWKQRVVDQPVVGDQLKHLDWDGWGWAGQDTEVYLVYDPTDQLRKTTDVDNGKHAPGLRCDVWQLRRLEPQWYSVTFFTNTGWNDCP